MLAPRDGMSSWMTLFAANSQRALRLRWRDDPGSAESAWICRSVAVFQLGESSDGAEFIARVVDSDRVGLHGSIRCFIGDENKHAAWLAVVLDRADWPRARHNWSDRLFRRIRHAGSYWHEHAVLLVAECFAMIYYPALYRCARTALLKNVCWNIVADECLHLRFAHAALAPRRPSVVVRLCYTGFAFGTGLVAALDHYAVVRRRFANPLMAALRTARHFYAVLERSPRMRDCA